MKKINALKELGLPIEYVQSVQDIVFDLLDAGKPVIEIMVFLGEMMAKNPKMCNAVLINFIFMSEIYMENIDKVIEAGEALPEKCDAAWFKDPGGVLNEG